MDIITGGILSSILVATLVLIYFSVPLPSKRGGDRVKGMDGGRKTLHQPAKRTILLEQAKIQCCNIHLIIYRFKENSCHISAHVSFHGLKAPLNNVQISFINNIQAQIVAIGTKFIYIIIRIRKYSFLFCYKKYYLLYILLYLFFIFLNNS